MAEARTRRKVRRKADFSPDGFGWRNRFGRRNLRCLVAGIVRDGDAVMWESCFGQRLRRDTLCREWFERT